MPFSSPKTGCLDPEARRPRVASSWARFFRAAATFRTILVLLSVLASALLATPALAQLFPTVTDITLSPPQPRAGNPATIRVEVTSPNGIPTGSVTVTGQRGLSIEVQLNGNSGFGTATATFNDPDMLTAQYPGTTEFAASGDTLEVAPLLDEVTTTTVTATPNPSTPGQEVTIRVEVDDFDGVGVIPTGIVTLGLPGVFADVNVSLNSQGVATFRTTQLVSGTIYANYQGDFDHFGSEGTVEMVVAEPQEATTTTVVVSPNPAAAGEEITILATVEASSGGLAPIGFVTFTGPNGYEQTKFLAFGTVVSATTTAVASGTVTASFAGIGRFSDSADSTLLTVGPGPTATSVTATPNPSMRGQAVVLRATVTSVPPTPSPPTGTVTFTEPGGGTQTVPIIAGIATVTTTTLATGTLTARYNGNSTQATSTGTVAVTVSPAPTTTTVTKNPVTSTVTGQPITLTAVIDWTASGVPTGNVVFTGPGGFSATVAVATDGTASTIMPAVAGGIVTAAYQGDALFAGSQGTVPVVVAPAATRTLVTAVPDPATAGATVTVTATVTAVPPGSGVPAGSVSFTSTGGINQTATLNGSGVATISFTATVSEDITATYSGSTAFGTSSDTVHHDVNKTVTILDLVASPDPSFIGQEVTLTADVDAPITFTGPYTGNVTFSAPGFFATVAVDAVGSATTTVSTLATGTIVATYTGDALLAGSTDSTGVTVNKVPTTTTVIAAPNPATVGASVVLSATVTANLPRANPSGGTITFTGPRGLVQTVPVDATGNATITVSAPAVTAGTVTAAYSGDPTFEPSQGTVAVVVGLVATTTSVVVDPATSVFGQSVTFTATVAPTTGTLVPNGTVTFAGPGGLNQVAPLNASGVATLTTTALATGPVTANYATNTTFSGSVGTAAMTVNAAPTTTGVTATPSSTVTGQSVTLTATVNWTAPGTPTGNVLFTGPGGFSATAALVSDGTATLNTSALVTGTVTAAYQGDTLFAGSQGTVAVTVAAAETFTAVTAAPDPATAGGTVTITATVVAVPPGSGIPDGTVTFTSPGGVNQTVPVDGSGNAEITIVATVSETITAAYSGSSAFSASSGSVVLDVNTTATITTVVASPDPSSVGQSVTLTATVVGVPSGIPTGNVTFTGPDGLNVTVALDGAGEASTTTTTLATGTVTAVYAGDALFAGSSDTTSVTVNQIATTTTVAAVPNPAVVGETVTITATVASDPPGGGTPTGSVTFVGPRGNTQTVALDGAGQATITATAEVTSSVTATYNGDTAFSGSQGTLTVTVGPGPTSTTVVVTPDPSDRGETVSLTATVASVAPATGTPTGTVTFTEPGGASQTVSLVGGQATVTTATLSSGTVTAVYNGSASHATSTGTDTVTVDPAPTTTSVTATPASSVTGQPVTLTAVIDWTATGTPTGNMVFTGPGGFSVTVAVATDGTASTTSSALITGTYTAAYQGDSLFAGSQGTVAVTVGPAATTTAVVAAPDPAVSGNSVTLTATVTAVSPGSGIPTGSVTFTSPGGVNQTATLDGSGVATISITATITETITATYQGSAAFTTSSGTVTLDVDTAASTTAVVATPDPSSVGQAVTLTATVVSAGGTPTGNVTFIGPGGLNVTVALDGGGVASTTTSTLATGTVQAVYAGDPQFAGSTGTTTVTVNQIATTTTVTANPNPTVAGASVTLTATVVSSPPGGGTPTGTVTFTGPRGLSQTVALDGTGQAVVTATAEIGGTLTATYNGDATFTASSGTVGVTVGQVLTATSLVVAPASAVTGQPVTFTATVASVAPGTLTPTGTVTFTAPGGLTQVAVLDASGVATLTTSAVASGPVTATYAGNATFAGSQGTASITVAAAASEIVLTVVPNPSQTGQSVTLTATVTPVASATGVPTGTVTFTGPRGMIETVPLAGGTASITKPAPGVGGLVSGTVTATYNGSAEFATSTTSAEVTIVGPNATATTVAATPNPSVVGQTVTLTATVTGNSSGPGAVPTGAVVFTGPNGLAATVPLDDDGTASLVTNSLSTGTVTAVYGGSAEHAQSEGTVDVVVNRGATATVVTASPNPSQPGEPVTLTATVTGVAPATGTPTGTITFTGPGGLDATVPLSGGTASFTTGTLTTGTVMATYSGDPGFEPSAGMTDVVVVEFGTVTIRVVVDGDDIVVGFTSPAPELNLSVPVSGGTGEAGPIELASGEHEVVADDLTGAGYGITAIECSDKDSTVDIPSRSASIELAPGEAVTCTFHLLNSRGRTMALIEDFLENRGRLILANQPDLQRRIDRLNGGPAGSGNPIGGLMNYMPGIVEGRSFAVSTSLGAIEQLAGREQQSDFDAWFDGTFALFDTSDASGSFGLATFGADYLLSPDVLVGGFVQLDRTAQSATNTVGEIEGTGFLVGPYATIRLIDNLYLDLVAGAGMSANTVDPFGIYSDDFDAVRWLLSATLQGDWAIENWTFSPRARFSYFEETSDSYTDSIGVPIPSITVGVGEVAVGPGVSYEFVVDEDIIVDSSIRLDALADMVNTSTFEGLTDVRARLEGAVDFTFPGGATLGLSLAYDGLGSSDLTAISGGIELSAPLN